jgi:hypothetical protein
MIGRFRATASRWLAATILMTASAHADVTISSRLDQRLALSGSATWAEPITITRPSGAKAIGSTSDIRITIPATLGMTWDNSDTSIVCTGSAASKVETTLQFENSDRTALVPVTNAFDTGDQVTIYGMKFSGFTALGKGKLEVDVDNDGVAEGTDDKEKTISDASLASAAPQAYELEDANLAAQTITITEGATAAINSTSDLRIRIPSTMNLRWDTSDTTVSVSGTAAAKIHATTPVSFAASTLLVIDVVSNLAAGETVVIDGLTFTSPTDTSPADKLELILDGSDTGAAYAFDTNVITTGKLRIEMSAAAVSASGTALGAVTITDPVGQIGTAQGIRLAIPINTPLKWSVSQNPTLEGTRGKDVVYETVEDELQGNKVMRFKVNANFSGEGAGDTLVIEGMKVDLADGAASADFNALMLLVEGPGKVNAAVGSAGSSGKPAILGSGGTGGCFLKGLIFK